MSKLEEILKKENKIGFILESDGCKKFLQWAKANNLKWMNGQEIRETDDFFFHMVEGEDKTIANVSALCWIKDKNNPVYRMTFKDFLKNS